MTKPKIAILGGGIAGVTAAYFLSGCDQIKASYDIVLYQQGWRLGGKGASGRGRDNRIEEHGLHVWFGYYENAFRLLRDCHEELNERAEKGDKRWSTTMHSIEEGFRPVSSIGIVEDEAPGWPRWVATFPENDLSPWDRDLISEPADWDVRWYLETLLTRSVELLAAYLRSAADEAKLPDRSIEPGDGPGGFEEVLVGLGQRLADVTDLATEPAGLLATLATRYVEAMARCSSDEPFGLFEQVLAAAGRLLDAVRLRLDEQFVSDRASVRRIWSLVDVLLAIVRGLLYHRVASEEDLEELDGDEFRAWLIRNGALAESTTSSLVRTVAYDLPFAYQNGDPDLAACGAGTAVRTLFRAFFTYRGAIMWKLNSGMGDVVFAPLYELLQKRDVKFKFFHQVTRIATDGERVSGFRVRKQGVDPYKGEDRLLSVEVISGSSMPPGKLRCWPSTPKGWCTPTDAEALEAWWGAPHGQCEDVPVGKDDLVVFALPLATVEHVAPVFVREKEAWRDLVSHVKTTATQAMQIWVDRPAAELGWFEDAVVGGYDAPYDTFADMPELRFQERVKNAATVLYLCAVLPDGSYGSSPGEEDNAASWVRWRQADVKAWAQEFIARHAAGLWPGAVDPATGEYDARIQLGTYVRGNFQPSDRYVLSVPGSVRYRLDPGNTGYKNLMIAGDWTRCVINAGCVEAATISGMLAAEAILQRHGIELPVPIIGRSAR